MASYRTPLATLSYPRLYVAERFGDDDSKEPSYSVTLVFDEAAQATPEFKALKKAAAETAKEKWGEKAKEIIQNMRYPLFHDGSKEYGEGTVFLRTRRYERMGAPQVVAANVRDPQTQKKRVISQDEAMQLGGLFEIFPGAQAYVTVNPYTYDRMGNKGVSFGLNNVAIVVQPLDERTRIAGGASAEEEFDDMDDEDLDLSDLTEEQEDEVVEAELVEEEPEEVEPEPEPKKKPAKKAAAKKKKAAPKKAKESEPAKGGEARDEAVDLDDLF